MLFFVALLALVATANAKVQGNATQTFKSGMTCTSQDGGKPTCVRNAKFDAHAHELIKQAQKALQTHKMASPKVGAGDVCSAVTPYTPSFCTCTNSATGADVACTVPVKDIDTIQMTLGLNVCANPASISVSMTDEATGLEYDYTVAANTSGEAPTGIMIGVPGVGDAEVLLD